MTEPRDVHEREHAPRPLARAGAISFAGSVLGALLGFLLTFVLARSFGADGAGVVLQAIAVFMLGLGFARLGLDTAATWIVPQLLQSEMREVGPTIRHTLVLALAGGLVAAGGTVLVSGWVFDATVRAAVMASAWAMPLAAVTLVGTAALRALGGIRAYILIVQIAVPALRVVFVVAVAALGYGATTGGLAWAVPYAVGAALTVGILGRALTRRFPPGLRGRIEPGTRRRLRSYSAGRMAATLLEQGLLWLDVLLVGFIVGTTAAGIYGTAARFVAAGLIVDTALRFVMAPIFSSLIYRGRLEEVQELFVRSTIWLVLLSVPIYLALAVYAPLVLSWFGPGFSEGERALQILCVGTALTLTAGNIHTMLLMAGRSGQAALNKLVVLATNVGLNVLLVPRWGIEAAAAVWVASMLLDASLATWQVRKATGVRAEPAAIARAVLVTVLATGVPALAWRWWLGPTAPSLLAAAATGLVVLGVWTYLDRSRLQVAELVEPVRLRFRG